MPSKQVKQRIDAFLDEAKARVSTGQWQQVAEQARAAPGIESENENASALRTMARSAVRWCEVAA